MKTVVCISFLLVFLESSNTEPADDLRSNVLGYWEYQSSFLDSTSLKIENEVDCPVQQMIFRKCNDSVDLIKFPSYVREQRKNNLLRNICCETYNNNVLIDTYFPVANRINSKTDSTINIFNYGYLYKSEYIIEKLNNDTMIIYDDKNYYVEGRKYREVRHLYLKR